MYEEFLMSCPLCGKSDAHVAHVTDDIGKTGYNAECPNCVCATKVYKKAQDAIDAWNRRSKKFEYALMPCPLCGGYAEIGHYGYCGEEIDTELYAVRCSKCHFSTPNTTEDTLGYVVSVWNERA